MEQSALFWFSLQTAQRWCALTSRSLRSTALKPSNLMYASLPGSAVRALTRDERRAAVLSVVRGRCRLVHDDSASVLRSGRLLAFQVGKTLHDGAAEEASGGFFDENDEPPWDCWIDYDAARESEVLYAWVPDDLVGRVQAGIDACLGGALAWVDE